MRTIFEKVRLRPSQLRTVAERRFGDAIALRDTQSNARANGAMYLAGFVIECLLKAALLERFPWLQGGVPERRSKREQQLWSLAYRSHDLSEILAWLPEVVNRLTRAEPRGSGALVQGLKSICSQWTIHARYSPQTATITDANRLLEKVAEVKKCLT